MNRVIRTLLTAGLSLAGRIMQAYSARVTADGGVVEATACATSTLTSLDSKSLLQSATFVLAPSGYKSGVIYAELPSNGNGDFTVSGVLNKSRVNSNRIVELPVTNNTINSEDINLWNLNNAIVSANSALSPIGTNTADLLIATNANGEHNAICGGVGLPVTNTNAETYSVYAKAAAYNYLGIRLNINNSWVVTYFNLSNGTIVSVGAGMTAIMQSVGNGWYRCIVTYLNRTNTGIQNIPSPTGTGLTFTGDNTSGILIWGAQLEFASTAGIYIQTGASARTYFAGVVQSSASNGVLATDYTLNGCPNILLEPQRTNLYTHSDLPNSTGWSRSAITFPSNNLVTTPYGTIADNLLMTIGVDGAATRHRLTLNNTISVTNGEVYVMSVFVKKASQDWIQLCPVASDWNTNDWANFNVSSGYIGATGTGAVATIESYPNGWYRCSLVCRCINTNASSFVDSVILTNNTDSVRYPSFQSLSSAPCFYVCGFQFELGNYLTSYIPTVGVSATRQLPSIIRSNIYTNGLIGASGGTWLVELKNNISYTRDLQQYFGIGDTIALQTNSIFLIPPATAGRFLIMKCVNGIFSTLFSTTTDFIKVAIKWDGATADVFVNGIKQVSATAFTTTLMENLRCYNIGVSSYLSQMALWNTPLSDAQCISLSSYTTFEVAKQLLDKVIADAIADGGTYKQSNYDASIDKIVKVMEAFGTTNIASKMVAWVDPEYLPYRQSTEAGTASLSGCRKLYDLFRRVDFSQTTPASMPLLLLHSGENYWWSGGTLSNYCSTPNAAANQITGDIDIIAKISLFTKNTVYTIISKYVIGGFAYMLRTNAAGGLQLSVSLNGSTNITTQSTSSTPFGVNEIGWVRATRIASTGVVAFYTSTDGVTWTQLGNTVTNTAGSIFLSNSIVEVGTYNNGGTDVLNGRVFRATISNSIGGTPVVDFNPQSFNPSTSQTQWTSATGEVWTINLGTASTGYKGALVYRNMIMADAIDDAMASGNVTIGGQQVGIYSSARLLNSPTTFQTYVELGNSVDTNVNSFALNTSNGAVRRFVTALNGGTLSVFNSSNDPFNGRLQLVSSSINTSLPVSTEVQMFTNGSAVSAGVPAIDQNFSFTTPYPLFLFSRAGNSRCSNMSLHDLMLVTDITKRTEMENIIRSMSQNFAF